MIELAAHCAKACFNVAQTLTISQLGEGESKELIPAGKSAEFIIAIITSHAFLKLICRKVIHSVARISFGRHSYPIVRGGPRTVGDVFGTPGKIENSQKKFKSKNLGVHLTHAESGGLTDRDCDSRTPVRRPLRTS